ncbi:MAG: hypothetical protein JJT75_09315 [Opitutales bacterium]|nr:hypothetical protein [Opitutales bacterium]MCH8540733.1 hypothetical protein [Opitutales bacterium]
MRKPRVTAPEKHAIYHLTAKTLNEQPSFDEVDLEHLRQILFRTAKFANIQVFTYCFLPERLHALIEVPPAKDKLRYRDEELIQRYAELIGEPRNPDQPEFRKNYLKMRVKQVKDRFRESRHSAAEARATILGQMHDLSAFGKLALQKMTIWYNTRHERTGPLWSTRFRSELLDRDSPEFETRAAYIDLLPVQHGLVEDPADYPFSGYGASEQNDTPLPGLSTLVNEIFDQVPPEKTLDAYRTLLLGDR